MVIVCAVLAVGVVYGLGYLLFAWWDGGVLRRILLGLVAAILIYGLVVYHRANPGLR
ncbi:hypothetical protein [Granulicella arctica]|uniref:Uncharacterized protein n=1 Tax=Granulicella arctica TaxID=940613 RepID=A0A7Y9PKP4_9BACT|nr:hypothetical protein [Granulicella arctica]NYF80886.1 hypothetical protein [Granulicella arctica]